MGAARNVRPPLTGLHHHPLRWETPPHHRKQPPQAEVPPDGSGVCLSDSTDSLPRGGYRLVL